MQSRGVRFASWVALIVVGASSFGCAKTPVASGADQRIPWNQEHVTELAQALNSSVRELRRAALNEPALRDARRGQAQGPATRYLDALRDLERATGQLARQLEAGQGFEDTLGTARRVGTLLRDVQVQARRLMLTESQWQVIDPALDIIQKLSPYYSSQSPLLSATRR